MRARRWRGKSAAAQQSRELSSFGVDRGRLVSDEDCWQASMPQLELAAHVLESHRHVLQLLGACGALRWSGAKPHNCRVCQLDAKSATGVCDGRGLLAGGLHELCLHQPATADPWNADYPACGDDVTAWWRQAAAIVASTLSCPR